MGVLGSALLGVTGWLKDTLFGPQRMSLRPGPSEISDYQLLLALRRQKENENDREASTDGANDEVKP